MMPSPSPATNSDDSPRLPVELAESVLVAAAHTILWTDPRWFIRDESRHDRLAALVAALPCSANSTLAKVAVPGMLNGCAKLTAHETKTRHISFILNKHKHELFDDDDEQTYIDALSNNAVPVLDWLAAQPDFEFPDLREFHLYGHPVLMALERKAYDALEWACQRRKAASYGLMDDDLADMLRSKDARAVRLAVAWLKAGHHVEPYLSDVASVACEVGLVEAGVLIVPWWRLSSCMSKELGIVAGSIRRRQEIIASLAEAFGRQEVVEWWKSSGCLMLDE